MDFGVTSSYLRTLKEWLCYKRSLILPLCLIFGLFLSYTLPGTRIVGELKDWLSSEHLDDPCKYIHILATEGIRALPLGRKGLNMPVVQ